MSIESFLNMLSGTSRGKIFLANMHASFAQDLVSVEKLKEFLTCCASALEEQPAKNPVQLAEDVSSGEDATGKHYLRQCRVEPFTPESEQQITNTLNSVSFHSFMLNDKYKDGSRGLPVVLPMIPVDSDSGADEYRDRLRTITSDAAWKKAGATIGKPLPIPTNCWVTSNHFDLDPDAPDYPDDPATRARDELGLIDTVEGSFLLRLSFSSRELASISGHELARPVFSDLGNARFRVHQTSPRAVTYAAQGWGATTHLGKFGNPRQSDSTGVCERVSSALPLAELNSLAVELLGKVTSDVGIEAHDSDEAYAIELLAGNSEQSIKEALLQLFAS